MPFVPLLVEFIESIFNATLIFNYYYRKLKFVLLADSLACFTHLFLERSDIIRQWNKKI